MGIEKTPLRRSPRFLRRSPRFLCQIKNHSEAKRKPKDPISKQTLHKSTPNSSKKSSLKGTDDSRSTKCCNRTPKPVEESQRRRSPRLASREGYVADKSENLEEIEAAEKEEELVEISTPKGGEERRRMRRVEGEKRGENGTRRGKAGDSDGRVQGWSKDQEAALRMAFLTARPSPHFWKKVAKMVPGKSAQECFDRVHADLATPPQHQPLSRTIKLDVPSIVDFSSSTSSTIEHTKPNAKRSRRSKQTFLNAQKTARHILRKHQLIDRSREADLFSVLEPDPSALPVDLPQVNSPATPESVPTPLGYLKTCNGRPSSAHTKKHSRFKPRDLANYSSPEVLKPIKNMALHEKYINQLHSREVRRRTMVKTKSTAVEETKYTALLETDVKAARNALRSEARCAITQFQHMQANPIGSDEACGIDEDDDADVDEFSGNDDNESTGGR